MRNENTIRISDKDYDNLIVMFDSLGAAEIKTTQLLEEEMLRADIVEAEKMPPDVVTMNSRVQFVDLDTGQVSKVRLSYPWESNIEEGKLSILAPIGSALIGLGVEQEITWPLPNGQRKRLRVTQVT
ncbi:nucleoside diphosphate kinase regulator [Oligoflexus tunisiensis]|uniref:nucleoside diphosphate kinase regulator n=1 Tax=Oligoflexus tunisiensis TaxID=708132 RepID=UPI000ACB4D37|nr:nucleoside diphosphate kinase regulator [Oligoflexus tunisiensis]